MTKVRIKSFDRVNRSIQRKNNSGVWLGTIVLLIIAIVLLTHMH